MPTTSAPHADDLEPCTENQVPTIPHTPLERPPSVAAATKRGEDYSDAFEEAWTAYPKREGGNSKRRAWRAWRARLRGGASTTDLTAGVTRYAGWIRATGKEHTPYIMQTATFFGPDEHWAEPWEIPPEASNGHPADDLPVPIEVVKDFLDTGGTFLSVAATRPEAFERIKAAYPDAWPRAEPYFRRLPFGRLMELKRSRDRFGLDAAIRDQLRSMAHDN